MELPPARLQSDDGAEGGLVTKDLPHYIYTHWLSLQVQTEHNRFKFCKVENERGPLSDKRKVQMVFWTKCF